jgi:uncharacterized protein YyaL (SSP411 family)
MGSHEDDRTKALLGLVREKYAPAQVVIYIDPTIPPRRLATANETVKALLDVKEDVPSLRVCEGGFCGVPIFDIEEARQALRR